MSCRADLPTGRTVCPACGVIQRVVSAPAAPTPIAPPVFHRGAPAMGPAGTYLPSHPRPPAHRAPPKPRAWIALTMVLMVAALGTLAAGGLVLSNRAGTERTPTAAERSPAVSSTVPDMINGSFLRSYCDNPGAAAPQVRQHVAADPSLTHVNVIGRDRGNISASPDEARGPARAEGGSTRLSPEPDGVFGDNVAAPVRTRSVTCVTLTSVTETGQQCGPFEYSSGPSTFSTNNAEVSLPLAQARWKVTVYELHGGAVLHEGEIVPPTPGCPDEIWFDEETSTIQHGLTDQMILDWVVRHFVGGAPS